MPHHLTERGRQQATRLAEELRGRPIARIASGPILRARKTAALLAAACGLPLDVTDALREYGCGVAEGRADAEAWALLDAVASPPRLWRWRSHP
nr:MAG: hypothetical protein DIU80_09165 [Chloroflexota bacterium]